MVYKVDCSICQATFDEGDLVGILAGADYSQAIERIGGNVFHYTDAIRIRNMHNVGLSNRLCIFEAAKRAGGELRFITAVYYQGEFYGLRDLRMNVWDDVILNDPNSGIKLRDLEDIASKVSKRIVIQDL